MSPAVVSSVPTGTSTPSPTALPEGEDAANESPRERGRVLLKRNPIASEYQVKGELGLSPGASVDGEGADFRGFFPLPPGRAGDPSLLVELNLNLHGGSKVAPVGGRVDFYRTLDEAGRWILQLRGRSSAGDRLIEHYQSAWTESATQPGAYLLDRARLSIDLIDTRNNQAQWRLDGFLLDGFRVGYEGTLVAYDDVSYRNRLEYQIGSGDVVAGSLELADDGSTLRAAAVTDASTRRYFGNTVTDRDYHRHFLDFSWESAQRVVELGFFFSQWDNASVWDGWNFKETGLDLRYALDEPYRPTIESTDGFDPLLLDTAVFNDFRIYDTSTSDTDYAVRLDWDQRAMLFDRPMWLAMGALHRSKERANRQERPVYLARGDNPFYLEAVAKQRAPGRIVKNAYALPTGLDPVRARNYWESHPEQFFYNRERSFIESAQNLYDSMESVDGLYLLAYQRWGKWRWEAGLRQEWTRTETLGTVTGPPEVLAGIEGEPLTELTLRGDRIEESFASFDAKSVPGGTEYQNLLPSLELRYEPDGAWAIRFAYYQLLMRPQYFDTVEYRRVSVPTRNISEGNPNLDPTEVGNFALAVDWTSEELGDLSFEFYYKTITDFFYGASSREVLDSEEFSVSRVENGDSGWIRGFQAQWSRSLEEFLPFLASPEFDLAYTYSESEAKTPTRPGETILVPERSRHLLEVSFAADLRAWSYRTGFSYQSRSLDDVADVAARDGYREAVLSWDHSFSRQLWGDWTLRLNLRNILNHPERQYEGASLRVTNNQYSFYSLQAGMHATF